ncbi:Cellulose synthase [Dillenia turbinata]|uniref:Cellulose synthase n=1 Tax=Dillenia turbinata TaxID=194707 RepID=A0AAN8ULR3_9MAGN
MGEKEGNITLFETKKAKDRVLYRLFSASIFVGICLFVVYRVNHVPAQGEAGRLGWFLVFIAELWFGFYWFLLQFCRWNMVYRCTFKDRLSQRYEKRMPGVDVFVCTADPSIEPPVMVINTVLSLMAYDYPTEKLSVYLSDDGGSEFTFYAMLEASQFAKHWLPFCRKFKIEPRSPEAYFTRSNAPPNHDSLFSQHWYSIKKLYEGMKCRIENATKQGKVAEEMRKRHKGFQEWDMGCSRRDHAAILQILIDGRKPHKTVDDDGRRLPTLVYLAREKRPQYHHNFKAGAMNALIRVSSKISSGSIILNVDCDMYSNNSESVRDALCFFMDDQKGHEIAYVQYPQLYENITKNDLYGSLLRVTTEVELPGLDACGGPCYIGSGCFHRRESLSGLKYTKEWKTESKRENNRNEKYSTTELEEICKVLASCTYEENTQWGKEMGVKYGTPIEDIITGLSIQCKGWKSIYYHPERESFVGLVPTTLLQALVQHKRWSEGHLQIFLSEHNPLIYGHNKIPLRLQLSYSPYSLWSANCFATLWYVSLPALFLVRGISLFPKISSPWILPFLYFNIAKYGYSLGEFVFCGGTVQGWWNDTRIWVFRCTTSYFFAFVDTMLNVAGLSESGFVVTAKVTEDDVSQRFEQEIFEFATPSPMFIIIATLAMLNMFSLLWAVKRVAMDLQYTILEPLAMQIVVCIIVIALNIPVYQGLFFRKDRGRMPTSVTIKSLMFALLACSISLY